jgi:predicted unusual protein kinase regulating ubiquinone biosynthesis (AarF/ABC1/UbiB family)/DNA-binding XRE family transcriptional regulator
MRRDRDVPCPPRRAPPSEAAARLRRVRAALALSQRELAAAIGVTSGAIAQWENDDRAVPGPILRLLSAYEHELGITPPEVENARVSWWSRSVEQARAAALMAVCYGPLPRSPIARDVRRAAMRQYVRRLSELKGLSMKLAQMATGLDVVLPEEEFRALWAMQRGSTAMPAEAVRVLVQRELGQRPAELFAEWESRPIVTASIGQVHRARLRSGERVAVKVQYGRIVDMLRADLVNARVLERTVTILLPGQRPGELFEELRGQVLEECDYALEASHQRRFQRLFAGRSDIHIPDVVDALSTRRVLTSAWMEGLRLDEFVRTAASAARDAAASTIWDFYHQSILKHGIFNTDPNPGNFLFRSDGVVFLDFGRVKEFDAEFVARTADVVRALLERDLPAYREAIVEMGCVPDPAVFDFHYSFRAMLCFYRPCLQEEPFTFTADHIRRMWSMLGEHNVNRDRIHYPAEFLFIPQFFFGVTALFVRLGAAIACRSRILDLLYEPTRPRPAPYTIDELRAWNVP